MRAAGARSDFVAKKIWPLNALLVAIDDVNERAGRGISHKIRTALSPTRADKFWPSGIGVARTENAAAPPCLALHRFPFFTRL